MKKIKNGNLQGRAGELVQGWLGRLGGLALGGVVFLAAFGPIPAKADASRALTQLEYIRWLAQLSDSTSQFSVNSTAADYVQWARDSGMNPNGGWEPTALLTRAVLAQTLAQFYGLKAVKGETDFARLLEREGIIMPTEQVVTRAGFVSVVDEFGFQTVTGKKAKKQKTALCPSNNPDKPPKLKFKCTPPKNPPVPPGQVGRPPKPHGNNGVGNGIDPQPPGNPPINDGPGTGPGNPGNSQ